ncbi:LysR family transcriptional regulator, pca operon transcriptional activator [Palleronia salina]|uniref:LysR family transcriptional regulator, pca operon transcriptional activator n=1 Tax=Palleronia salina TaxID=313368 RepID=A0A1M6LL18_9RHOB|nr:pca operon transcription factor PcaQ [Palleronia salina]SHJ71906.1 LysR family transcriptional regulator, pca operon transcriptional activator [Palleronia salina]
MNWPARLHLRHIRSFLEIARAESISKAAETLNVTQPAVSKGLKELEEILGTRLFDRVGRGLRLNEAGRIFQAHAAASMSELMRAQERLARDGGAPARLSVGVLPTAAGDLLPRAALAFGDALPKATLHVLTGPNWLLFNHLRDGTVDLVVGRMPEQDSATGVTFEQLYLEDIVLVCRPGHPLLTAPAPEAGLPAYPLILPPRGAVISATVERYLASIGLPGLRAAIETVALPIGRKVVRMSDAVWFISRGVVADDIDDGKLRTVALQSPLLSGPVGISVSRAAPISVARDVFADCLRAAVRG